jgi:hypothetical protein
MENSARSLGGSIGEKYLGKFGWRKGEGLGPEKSGITEPIKLPHQEGRTGLGGGAPDSKALFHPWWEDLYNQAISKVSIGGRSGTGNNSG